MREFYLRDYYSNLSFAPQATIRIASFALFAISAMTAIVFLFSDAPALPYAGALILLVVADQFFHYFIPQKSARNMPKSGRVNVAEYLSPKNKFIIQMIRGRATEFGESFSLNFLMYSLGEKGIRGSLKRLDVNPDEFADKILEKLKVERESGEATEEDLADILSTALEESVSAGENELTPADIFIAILRRGNESARKVFGIFGITVEDLRGSLIFSRVNKRLPVSRLKGFATLFSPRSRRLKSFFAPMRTPILSAYSLDMTKLATEYRAGFMVGHRDEYNDLVGAAIRPENAAVVLVGEEGIGKETVVEHLAYSIVRDDVPKDLLDKRVYRLDTRVFLEGGEEAVAERIETAFRQAESAGNAVIYIRNADDLLNLPYGKVLSAAIESAAASGRIRFILAASRGGWKMIGKFGWFRSFKIIYMAELTEEEALIYLAYHGSILERKWGIKVKISAIKRAVALAKKYSKGLLPGSAEKIIEAGLEEAKAKDSGEIGAVEVMAGAIRLLKNGSRDDRRGQLSD